MASGARPGARPSAGPVPLPAGFRVGHATRSPAGTGCTVVICPPGTRGAVDIRGGGTGTRELEPLSPLANAEGPTAVLMTGGSAFGLAAADGVMRWLEQRELGRWTPIGVVPLVSTAVVFDASAGMPGERPGPDHGYAACEASRPGVPQRGRVGAGAGVAVGKVLGREHATLAGVGYAAMKVAGAVTHAGPTAAGAMTHADPTLAPSPTGFGDDDATLANDVTVADGGIVAEDVTIADGTTHPAGPTITEGVTVAAIVVANAFGDVLAEDGTVLGGPRGDRGQLLRSADLIPQMRDLPDLAARPGQSTTLACVCTDAALDKRGCGIVARGAGAGIARAVDPAFTPNDGDVAFCLASGTGPAPSPGPANSWTLTVLGTAAATVTAAAIRDAIREATAAG
jgi:L-aminopeptidase/D-esterase-like protein